MVKLQHHPAVVSPDAVGSSFITSPKVDAYNHLEKTNWAEFVRDMKFQASCWAFESGRRSRPVGGYRYPAIGCFDNRKFAVFVATGDPALAKPTEMEVVAFDWPDNWNVT